MSELGATFQVPPKVWTGILYKIAAIILR